MGQLSIRSFGGLTVSLDNHRVTHFHSRKDVALLLYLARTHRAHPRETLAELLWPNRSLRQALSNLRRALHSLRQTLPQHVASTRYDCSIGDAPCWLDATEFETVVASMTSLGIKTNADAHRLDNVMQLYQGDFLAGFALDSTGFEEWVLLEREHLRRHAIEALDMLVDWSLGSRTYADGIAWANDLLKLDPLRESTHRHLMRLYAYTGERNRALTQYNTLCQVLQDELAVEPMVETVQLYDQIQTGDELVAVSPPPDLDGVKVRERVTSNLPTQPTPFVGRADEMVQLSDLLGDPAVRLVTLLGPGGMGKTRLALEVAENQLEHYADGVYFVSLAPLSTPANMVLAIADAVDYPIYQEGEPKDQLLEFFHNKSTLLLLDSFEQLRGGAELVNDILTTAPQVKVLVTSRERLSLSAETLFIVGGMRMPDLDTADNVLTYSAVELFLQAAHRTCPNFEPDAGDLRHIAHICRLVAGMPLGILLAAAWIELLSPHEIIAELTCSLDFLATQLGDIPERHRSIRAVFESTWAQLAPEEREVFMRLSVLRGGFSREAAHAIADADLQMLMALVHKSLVQRHPNTNRCDIHDLLREYAHEKLDESGEAAIIQDAHMRYFLELLSQRETDLKGHRQLAALDEIEADFENVRAAWEWAVQHEFYEAIGPALESLLWFCLIRSRYQAGKDLFEHARAVLEPLPGEDPHPIWGRVVARLVWLQVGYFSPSYEVNLDERRLQVKQSLAVARQERNQREIAFCLELLGQIDYNVCSDTEGLTLWEESLELLRDTGDRFHLARLLVMFAYYYYHQGDYEKGYAYAQQSAEIRREIGDRFGLAESLGLMGHSTDDDTERERLYHEGLAIARGVNSAWDTVNIMLGLGNHMAVSGHIEEGKALMNQALALTIERNLPSSQGWALLRISQVLCYYEEDYAQAKQLAEQSRPLLAFDAMSLALAEGRLAYTCCELGDFSAAKRHHQTAVRLWAGKIHHCWGEQDLFVAGARIAVHEGNYEQAAELLGLAEKGRGDWIRCPMHQRLRTELIAQLGTRAFSAAYERGTTIDLGTALAELLDGSE